MKSRPDARTSEPDEAESSARLFDRMLKSRTILLSSDVSPASARRIVEQFLILEAEAPDKPITLMINSPGGDVFAASQIYTMLREHKGKITVKIDGIAASAASIIAMAGDETLIAPTGMLMCHNPMTWKKQLDAMMQERYKESN